MSDDRWNAAQAPLEAAATGVETPVPVGVTGLLDWVEWRWKEGPLSTQATLDVEGMSDEAFLGEVQFCVGKSIHRQDRYCLLVVCVSDEEGDENALLYKAYLSSRDAAMQAGEHFARALMAGAKEASVVESQS